MKEKDIVGRELLERNEVFADVVNGFLFKGEPVVHEDELEIAPQLSVYTSKDGIRSMERDVIKYWRKNQCYIALIGIENQAEYDGDMVLRDLGYLGTAYRDQMNDKAKGRYPVITLVLYGGVNHWKARRKLSDCFEVPEELLPWFKDYEMNLIELCHISDEEADQFTSLFKYVADAFAHEKDRKYKYAHEPIDHAWEVIKFINMLDPEKFENTVKSGYKDGKTMHGFLSTEERMTAFAEGEAEGKAESICNLMRNRNLSFEEAAEAIGLLDEEKETIRKLVEEMLQNLAA